MIAYLFVFMTVLASVGAWAAASRPEEAVFHGILLLVALGAAAIDLQLGIIPDRLNLAGFGLGWLGIAAWGIIPWDSAILGAALGAGFLWLVDQVWRGGLGGGDIKLAGVMGVFLGPGLTALALLTSFIAGALVGVGLLVTGRAKAGDTLPFGPFLAFGAALAVFFGDRILEWYLTL